MINPVNSNPADRALAWSNYWRHGALHSLPTSYRGNYEGEIRHFWAGVLAETHAGQKLLDIGTGNGALPLLTWELRSTRSPAMDAVDIADVAPAWLSDLPSEQQNRIRFHASTRAEHLPFADACFDLVCSQYGFEYTDTAAASMEAARVLRPGGTLALVMHHSDSQLAAVAAAETSATETLCAPGGLLESAEAMAPWMGMAGRGELADLNASPQATSDRQRFNSLAQALATQAATEGGLLAESLQWVFGLLRALQQGQIDTAEAAMHLSNYADQLRQAQLRSEELCLHALDDARMGQLQKSLESSGFSRVETGLVHHDRLLMGWTLRATRA
ncbi:MAG TPA: class I SAM-dependent methyltransferase [Candidatus Luteimonas excrementigallinarum]|nr:class I SAM-dependent methyltransferase [Candidatus Luteimonas excrementigallinarum]